MSAGVTQTYGEKEYVGDAFRLGSDVSEDAARGHCLVRHASEVDSADFSSGAAADIYNFLGVVDQVYGGEAAGSATEETVDTLDVRVAAVKWGRNIPCKIEDSATVALNDPLTFSTTGEGALRTAVAGEPIVAVCKKAITSGAVDQTTLCDVLPPSGIKVGETELPVVTGLTALAGGGQAGATLATGRYSVYTTVATDDDSGLLPPAVLGEIRTIKNAGAAVLEMFPGTSDSINGLSANTGVKLEPGEELTFYAVDATVWETDEKFFYMHGRIADVSTAGSTFSEAALYTGEIVEIYSTLSGTIATADAALTFELEGTAITGGAITITASGSAAGDVDSATPTAARTITKGNAIEQITDGASTNAESAELVYKVRRTYQ